MDDKFSGQLTSTRSKTFAVSWVTRVGSDTSCVKLKLRQTFKKSLASVWFTREGTELRQSISGRLKSPKRRRLIWIARANNV